METDKIECWETLCLENSHCDIYDNINENPYCLKRYEDCPNKIVIAF